MTDSHVQMPQEQIVRALMAIAVVDPRNAIEIAILLTQQGTLKIEEDDR